MVLRKWNVLFHLGMYYLSWYFCIRFAAHDQGGLAVSVVLVLLTGQLLWLAFIQKKTQGLYYFIGLITLAGTVIDSLFIKTGWMILSANPFAGYFSSPWMISLWLSFAVLFYAILSGFIDKYKTLTVLTFFGFSSAYATGAVLGAAAFPHGLGTCLVVGLLWAVAFPALTTLYKKQCKGSVTS
jgi:hypothetical protein